jgi:hypothetical protein
MTDARERAIGALLERRGIAGLFGRPEAEADVAAIEAVVDLVPMGAVCSRCSVIDAALSEEGSRVYRGAAGGLVIVTRCASTSGTGPRRPAT